MSSALATAGFKSSKKKATNEPKKDKRKRENFYVCPLCFEAQQNKLTFDKHIMSVHDQALQIERFVLGSIEEFETWKKATETETNTRFKMSFDKGRTRFFVCNRSGNVKKRNYNPNLPESKKRMLRIGSLTRKMGSRCPAQIRLRIDEAKGLYHVEFCGTHIGHALDEHIRYVDLTRPVDLETKKIKNPKRIPKRLQEDPVMMEHDYCSWLELFDDESEETSSNRKRTATAGSSDSGDDLEEYYAKEIIGKQLPGLDDLVDQLKQLYSATPTSPNLSHAAHCNSELSQSLNILLRNYMFMLENPVPNTQQQPPIEVVQMPSRLPAYSRRKGTDYGPLGNELYQAIQHLNGDSFK